MKRMVMVALLAAVSFIFLACGSTSFHRGKTLLDRGKNDEAVASLEKATKSSPKNMRYKTMLFRARMEASLDHFEAAKRAIARDDLEGAFRELQISIKQDSSNQYAQDTLQKVVVALDKKQKEARHKAVTLEDMKKEAEKETGIKRIDPKANIPIVLKFNNASLKTLLDALSKASGINFIYDEKVEKDKKVTVDFSNVTLENALEYIMMQSKHFYKVLDAHTLIVIPDNKQKREEYEEQVIRTFYLSNAEAKDVFQLVRSIIQGKKAAMNQDLNSITIKDTPEAVALAQRIIEANDKSKGEVIVDVELVEVNQSHQKDWGIYLDSTKFTLGPETNLTVTDGVVTGFGVGPPLPLGSADVYHKGLWIGPIPNIVVNWIRNDGDSKVLARPQLRVMEGKKASVHIGDRVPIATASINIQQTQGNFYPTTSFTYQDVGVKIEMEPKVHHNKEVTLKLSAEVSSIGTYIDVGGGLKQPQIGSRKVQTEIRLEDGETSLLAGLIREEDRKSFGSALPFIADIPILRSIFSNKTATKSSVDVVLLLTPHIVRMPNITEDDLKPLWVGTEDRPRLQGFRETSFAPSPFEGAPPPPEAKGKEGEKPEKGAEEPPPDEDEGDDDAEEPPEDEEPPEEPQKPEDKPKQQARLLVSPTTFNAAAGSVAILNLVVVGAVDAKEMRVEMDFPTDLLKFEGADEGTFFKMGGGQSTFSAQEARPGLVSVQMGRSDPAGSSGSGLVARIRMKCLNPGQARANFGSIQVSDLTGQGASIQPVFAMVTVTPPAGGEGK